MMHLIDSNDKLKVRQIWQLPRANCGRRMNKAQVQFRNDWFRGDCGEWLDRSDVCKACKAIAQRPNPDHQFTYAIEESK